MVAADFAAEKLMHFTMTRQGGSESLVWIPIHRMAPTLAQKFTPLSTR
jgi:hypothetical protein